MSDDYLKRERRSTEFFDPAEDSTAKKDGARFDFCLGTGIKLSELPSWVAGRGNAADALEAALEPLHRALFGRPGKAGERRGALATYCGFPESQLSVMKAKLTALKKEQLKDLAMSLDMGLLVSVPVGDLAEGVLKFLQAPVVSAKAAKAASKVPAKKDAPKPSTQAAKKSSSTEVHHAAEESEPKSKKARTEVAPAPQKKKSLVPPSVDTTRVAVYKRVLSMTPEERDSLSLKGLRAAIAEAIGVEAEVLKEHADAIRQTASECVAALKAAETRVASGAAASIATTDEVASEEKIVAAEENA